MFSFLLKNVICYRPKSYILYSYSNFFFGFPNSAIFL